MKTLTIDAYYLGEFSKLVQEAILDGYRFDFESNENYPTAFGTQYHTIMVKEDTKTEVVEKQEEVTQTNKPGRKPKSV